MTERLVQRGITPRQRALLESALSDEPPSDLEDRTLAALGMGTVGAAILAQAADAAAKGSSGWSLLGAAKVVGLCAALVGVGVAASTLETTEPTRLMAVAPPDDASDRPLPPVARELSP